MKELSEQCIAWFMEYVITNPFKQSIIVQAVLITVNIVSFYTKYNGQNTFCHTLEYKTFVRMKLQWNYIWNNSLNDLWSRE